MPALCANGLRAGRLHLAATLFQFRQQSRTAFQLRGQRLDSSQRRGTDVMLHALDVVVDHLLVEPE